MTNKTDTPAPYVPVVVEADTATVDLWLQAKAIDPAFMNRVRVVSRVVIVVGKTEHVTLALAPDQYDDLMIGMSNEADYVAGAIEAALTHDAIDIVQQHRIDRAQSEIPLCSGPRPLDRNTVTVEWDLALAAQIWEAIHTDEARHLAVDMRRITPMYEDSARFALALPAFIIRRARTARKFSGNRTSIDDAVYGAIVDAIWPLPANDVEAVVKFDGKPDDGQIPF